MAKETYELPDETLQLIAASPSFDFLLPQQGTAAQFATPGISRSDLISALRTIEGPENPGFTRYANGKNAAPLSFTKRTYRGANDPAILSMRKNTPYVPPYVPPTVPPVPPTLPPVPPVVPPTTTVRPTLPTPPTPPITLPDIVDIPDPPDVVDPDPPPSIYTKPIVSDIPDEIDPDTIPLIPAPDILETIPTIYTKPIVSSIPDKVDPSTIPLIIPETPLNLPEIPTVVDKKDKSFFDNPDFVEYGPSRGLQKNPEDLPEEFDRYLVDSNKTLAPQPQPSLRDEIVKAIDIQPQPSPVAPPPAPSVPGPVGDPNFYEPYVPEPEFSVPDFTPEELSFIDSWLEDQFTVGGWGGGGGAVGGGKPFDDTYGNILEM